MKIKRTVRIQMFAAMFMALLSVCLCTLSKSYLSSYDKLQMKPAAIALSRSDRITADNLPEAAVSEAAEEVPTPFVPSLTDLNLASLYGEGDDQEDSLGAEAAETLSLMDSNWLASIYQLAAQSPEEAASGLGMPADSFKGLSFNKIDITFYDEKGNQISAQSNIQEIMAMANTYFYYSAPEDYDAFINYATTLWENSHSCQCSISDIYYCDGSLEEKPTNTLPAQQATPAQAEHTDISETSASLENPESENVKEVGPGIALRESAKAQADSLTGTPSEAETLPSACPGHADLHIKAVIAGLSDSKKGLFTLDTMGNSTVGEGHWQGWTDENKTYALNLSKQDWTELYGLTLTPSFMANPLSYDEINSYISRLSENLSEDRKKLIYYALSSVGRVPYYWGGKPVAAGYERNHFGTLVEPDEKGRTMKGLDCSGWISWIYWSALNKHFSCESTGGLSSLGTPIDRNSLQPGDIILKTGNEAHVVMFLCWEDDGSMTVIHESSALVNNVTVTTIEADWPYYRKLID